MVPINNAYLEELTFRGKYYGKLSGKFEYAEGWLRHSHLGYCAEDFNPLKEALDGLMVPRKG